MIAPNFISLSFVLSTVLFIASCASFPVQEMSDARQAIEAAETAGASDRASTEYQRAQQLLESAEEAFSIGEYDKAKSDAREARKAALMAQEIAQSQK